MRVLYFDAIYNMGHKYFDQKIITNLSDIVELYVLSPRDWYTHTHKATCIPNAYRKDGKSKHLAGFICSLRNCLLAYKLIKQSTFDYVIAGEYELLSLPLVINLLVKKQPLVLIHHNNIDQTIGTSGRNRIKKYIFKRIQNKVLHITLESFISDFLVSDYGIEENRIYCWPHPIEPLLSERLEPKEECNVYDYIGISNSNDEEMINKMINYERETQAYKQNNIKILVKSRNVEYDDGALKVITGWLTNEEYKSYLNSANSMLIAFPSDFQFRVSNSVVEAFYYHIPVLGTRIPLITYYSMKYPSICKILNDVKLENIKKYEIEEDDFIRFYNDHCDEKIRNNMKLLFK